MARGEVLGRLLGTVIGAAQNRRFMNESYQREDTQLQRMAADASAAGINPLAALGASGAYSQTAGNYQPKDSGKEIGDALTARSPLEDELTEAQIGRTNAETADLLAQAQSRTTASSASAALRGSPAVPETTFGQQGKPKIYLGGPNARMFPGSAGEPQVTFPTGPFRGITPPGMVFAETAEEFGGEPAEWIQSIYNIMAHWMYNNQGRGWDYFREHGLPLPIGQRAPATTRSAEMTDFWDLVDAQGPGRGPPPPMPLPRKRVRVVY